MKAATPINPRRAEAGRPIRCPWRPWPCRTWDWWAEAVETIIERPDGVLTMWAKRRDW